MEINIESDHDLVKGDYTVELRITATIPKHALWHPYPSRADMLYNELKKVFDEAWTNTLTMLVRV